MTRAQREELRVVEVMVRMWCRAKHSSRDSLCESCQKLLSYAQNRVQRCPVTNVKSTCKKCEIHCYSPQMRERIREVMRYSGPRMVLRHPIMAIKHILK